MLAIDNLANLYSTAFSHLLMTVAIVMTMVGIVVPLIAAWFQARANEKERDAILQEVKSLEIRLKKEILEAQDEYQKKSQTVLKDAAREATKALEQKVEIMEAQMEGKLFLLQGNANAAKPALCADDYAFAAEKLMKGKDELNAQRAIKSLLNALEELNKEDFSKNTNIKENVESLLAELKNHDENRRYLDTVNDIKRELAKAQDRQPPKPPSTS